MEDPFAALLQTLQSVFNSATVRNGKYTIKPLQALKDAIDQYNPQNNTTFYFLLKSLTAAIPYIEKKPLNLSQTIKYMDILAKQHGISQIAWHTILEKHRKTNRFQFNSYRPSEKNLISWLSSKTGKPFDQLDPIEKTQTLLDYRNHHGFSAKLNAYLKKNPDFLFQLINKSVTNFMKIASTRLNLYLTDKQLATAIIQYIPELINTEHYSLNEVDGLVKKLNGALSNGRSIHTLLRNADAKAILEHSIFFQILQSMEYKNHNNLENMTLSHTIQDHSKP